MKALPITLPTERLAEVCRRWRVQELALFGSVLRDDFHGASDVDVLLTFAADADWRSWDLFDLQEELRQLFGREVDLVEQRNLENPYRRKRILQEKRIVYAAS